MALLQRDKVLITGDSGFVGTYIAEELNINGYDVVGIDTNGNYPSIYHRYNIDIRDRDKLNEVVKLINPKMAIHLAAIHYIPYCNNNPDSTFEVNVTGTSNLLEALRNTDVEKVFLASSAAVYHPSDMPHSELDSAWPTDIYGFSKRSAELTCIRWSKDTGIPVIIGRYFNMYGHGETVPHLIPTIINQLDKGIIKLGNVKSRRDYTYVKDNSKATVQLLQRINKTITVNLGTGVSYSAENIIYMISSIIGRNIEYTSTENKLRKNDQLLLVADMTYRNTLGIDIPKADIYTELNKLCKKGIGTRVNWGVE